MVLGFISFNNVSIGSGYLGVYYFVCRAEPVLLVFFTDLHLP